MLTTSDVARIYDTILSIPGMNETIKIDLKISRKNVLLLSQVIERGLDLKEDDKAAGLLYCAPQESLHQLKSIVEECIQKAGLVELSERLNGLGNSK